MLLGCVFVTDVGTPIGVPVFGLRLYIWFNFLVMHTQGGNSFKYMGFCHPWGNLDKVSLLALIWPSPRSCGHFRSEPMDRQSLFLCFCCLSVSLPCQKKKVDRLVQQNKNCLAYQDTNKKLKRQTIDWEEDIYKKLKVSHNLRKRFISGTSD